MNEQPPTDHASDRPAPGNVYALGSPHAPLESYGADVQTRGDAFLGGAAYGALGVAGALLGVFGSFYQGGTVGPVPVAAVVFSLLNLGAFWLAGWAMGAKLGAVIPAVTWLLVVIFLSSKRPEGDLVINSSVGSYVFLIGGAVGALIAIARTRSMRNWLLRDPGLGGLR